MKVVKEAATVSSAGSGLLLIRYDQIWNDGDDMGGSLLCDASAAPWLADHIEAASGPQGVPKVGKPMPPDHFTVYCGGSEWEPNVHVHNDRDPAAPRGGTDAPRGGSYLLTGISLPVAQNLAAQLRAFKNS